ncbi:UNVERIFIED_CONTAM: N-acyl-D-glucosamine 2-epimerase [Mumia flava]
MLTPEGLRLIDFARASAAPPVGFAWLDDDGRPDPRQPIHTWITTRMTYVFSLAALLDVDGAEEIAAIGVDALLGPLHDDQRGGWFTSIATDGSGPVDAAKGAYPHAFVALAAGTAYAAGIPRADALVERATDTYERRFLDGDGRVVESWDRGFTRAEPYRGANATMHTVEAFLALGDALDEPAWHRRALAMADHLVHDVARHHDWLLPEHFTPDWQPVLDYNVDRPADPFRPYGATPGHLLEWARLLVQLEASLPEPPGWLADDATALFGTAVRAGWEVDGAPGFVYTVDFGGTPVVRSRMHWVIAEAIAAAGTLGRRTGDPAYDRWAATWWDFTEEHHVDRSGGSWHHELDASNQPASTVWHGKPDVYHALGAILVPRLRPAPSSAVQLRR